jgi:hypothetical protein
MALHLPVLRRRSGAPQAGPRGARGGSAGAPAHQGRGRRTGMAGLTRRYPRPSFLDACPTSRSRTLCTGARARRLERRGVRDSLRGGAGCRETGDRRQSRGDRRRSCRARPASWSPEMMPMRLPMPGEVPTLTPSISTGDTMPCSRVLCRRLQGAALRGSPTARQGFVSRVVAPKALT